MTDFSELIRLYKESPEKVIQIFQENPALRDQILALNELFKAGEEVSVNGFKLFYREIYGRELPYVDVPVAEEFVRAFHDKKGVIYESWRGKGKSTFFAAWCPYVMGCRPVGSTALVRVNDQKAKEMGKVIADMIETNPGWKKIFPHIIPDERAGWSVENGFNVLDTRVTGVPGSKDFEAKYSKWRMSCLADHLSEKSLICAGVESGSIIGLHPTNGEWFDDLHDEQNTRSQAEMKKVVDIFEGNIIPTWFSAGGSPTLGAFCTPWSTNPPDVYQVMLRTGMFKHIKMPIYTNDPNGETFPPTGEKVKLTWPEMFPMEKVVEMFGVYKTRFGQMCLCDVALSKPKNMRYQDFPYKEIKWHLWPLTAGVDPVGVIAGISQGSGISHFAMGYGLKTPYNNVVIGGGEVEKCDANEGERLVVNAERTYRATFRRASVEGDGVGVMFIGMLSRNPSLKNKWSRHNTIEIGKGSKHERQYRVLQPLFANGTFLVSDEETPYLNGVREYLDNFPNIDKDSYLWDIGDTLVLIAVDIPEVWTRVIVNADDETIWIQPRKMIDPYSALLEGRR
jgi:hypothetical protein